MNHYQILGVTQTASPEDIKRAWKQRARALHPDNGGDVGQFARLSEAYADLSDPVRRAQYDAMAVSPSAAVPSADTAPAPQATVRDVGERPSRVPLASVPTPSPTHASSTTHPIGDIAQTPSITRNWMPQSRGSRVALGVGALAAAAGLGGAAYSALREQPWYAR